MGHYFLWTEIIGVGGPLQLYQLTPQQVIEPEVPYFGRKTWFFARQYEEKIQADPTQVQ